MAKTKENQKQSYTPINSWAAQLVDGEAFKEQVKKQQQYIQDNPTATTDHTTEEYREKYGEIYDNAPHTTSVDREVPEGESGADAGLMSSGDYAVVQHLKQVWADADALYKEAMDDDDDWTAEYWKQERDNAHLEAERIRANYGYSGGEDGSMYMDYRDSGLDVDSSEEPDDGENHGGSGAALPEAQAEDFSKYLEELYAAKKRAALAELEAAYQKNVLAFDQSEAGIAGAYQTARNQTAAASELAKRNFHEYAAASGLNNGTAGQAELARNVTLQNDLNTINAEQASSVAELQMQRAQAEIEYNNAIAQAQAEGDYELANALYEEKVRVQELLLDWEIQQQKLELQWYQAKHQVRQDDESLAFQQSKYEDTLEREWQEYQDDVAAQQQETLAKYGETFLKQGVMPSDEMLAAMGITKGQAQSYVNSVLAGKK